MPNSKIDVLLVCYNQEESISRALDSIFMQKSDFDFKVIVCDDFSTDHTMDRILEYKNRFGGKIEILESSENVGVTRNYRRGFASCEGDCIAVLEGDDYWNSPYKLQRQMDFLIEHTECSMSYHRYLLDDTINKIITVPKNSFPKIGYHLLYTRDLVKCNFIGNFSCCMYRREIVKKLDQSIFDMQIADWLFNMAVSEFGPIGYIADVMSVYVLHENGVWSGKSSLEQLQSHLAIIPIYDEYFKGKYANEFNELGEKLISLLPKRGMAVFKSPKMLKKVVKLFFPPIVLKLYRYIKKGIYPSSFSD